MSVIDLSEAKAFLDVIHDADDSKLQMLLDAAEDEAAQFMWRVAVNGACRTMPLNVIDPSAPSDAVLEPVADDIESGELPASVKVGVLLLLQASYQAAPDEVEKLRSAAEVKLTPYRCGMGV